MGASREASSRGEDSASREASSSLEDITNITQDSQVALELTQDSHNRLSHKQQHLPVVVVGAVPHRARPTAARVPTNKSLLLSPSKANALQSVHHVHPPGSVSLPVSAPVMAPVEATTSAASTPVCNTTPANHPLVQEENRFKKLSIIYIILF